MKKLVLIVEDDDSMRRMYKTFLTYKGYTILEANNGQQGLLLAHGKPDVIIIDMMPVINGLQLLEKLKADDETKNIPTIMLTNLESDDSIKLAMELGASKYAIKSNNEPQNISDLVEELIGKPS